MVGYESWLKAITTTIVTEFESYKRVSVSPYLFFFIFSNPASFVLRTRMKTNLIKVVVKDSFSKDFRRFRLSESR